ncbi:amidase [Tepidicaulis marinus]|uniref:Indoleacetamide hydrolase n=1 Tax=Tepidicaulis marinus TaxID=1333998 RepID=A0A081BCZ8_9HYPH|nr:amidase [Tepidicaulis marinus]GAK45916.1 amidase [Tepidicaulis marinus]
MGNFTDYDDYDGLGLAQLVKDKEVTPGELLDEALARAEALNPKLNAIVIENYEEARRLVEKGVPEGPFEGVPFLLKDLHLLWEGTETTFGSDAWKGYIADHNSTLTERYLAAGLVPFGKTNSPELGLTGTTEPRAYGPTRNPWNLERSPGGSSGGAAAAVAAGILPLANASDGGGSIRIPAAACGLFGMKPTRARTPMGPDRGEGWGGMSISHIVSHSVRDSAAMLDATGGEAPGDPYAAPAPERPYLAEMEREPGVLKIAFNTKRADGSEVEADVAEAIKRTAILCESLGHIVEEAAPRLDPQEMSTHQATLIGANVALALKQRGEARGREIKPGDVELITWLIAEGAKSRTAVDYAAATLFIHQMSRHLARFMSGYDVYLCPTMGAPSIPLGVLDMMNEDVGAYMQAITHYMPFTGLFNMTGQPSMSVPLFWSQDGMPIGSMFTGRFGDEGTLFRLAAQLEKAQPWKDRRPDI